MTRFTDDQLDALSTATVLARAGVGFVADDEAKRVACRELVASGHLVEIPDVANGFTVSAEFAAAVLVDAAQQAVAARSNERLRPDPKYG